MQKYKKLYNCYVIYSMIKKGRTFGSSAEKYCFWCAQKALWAVWVGGWVSEGLSKSVCIRCVCIKSVRMHVPMCCTDHDRTNTLTVLADFKLSGPLGQVVNGYLLRSTRRHHLPSHNKHRVHTEKSIQNSQTFYKPLQYGTKKQHKGMQLCRTSGKGAQPLL